MDDPVDVVKRLVGPFRVADVPANERHPVREVRPGFPVHLSFQAVEHDDVVAPRDELPSRDVSR